MTKGDKEARNVLFSAVEEAHDDESLLSSRPLVKLFNTSDTDVSFGNGKREHRQHLLETIKNFDISHARRFFASLKPILERVVEEEDYVPESAYQDDDEQSTDENDIASEIVPDLKSTENLEFLKYSAQSVEAYLDCRAKKKSSKQKAASQLEIVDEAFEIALILHNILFSLDSCGPNAVPVQGTILSLCESWWHSNAANRECLVLQSLPILLVKALGYGKSALKADIKRLLKIQQAFEVIDFSDESSHSLRSLLLRLVSSPFCLRMSEGRKFLAGLFHLDCSLVKDLHQAIRVQIPDAKKTILLAYGEIYLRAWKESAESPSEIRQAIEQYALQDLMYAVLHINSTVMLKSVLTVLEPIHQEKKSPDVENLLYRMYGPILWRSLSAANAQVRINAAAVLADVFPLQDRENVKAEAAVEKGVLVLKALLQDKDQKVREAGSKTTGLVLSMFWDAIPTADIGMLLNHIVTEHASDSTSSPVRAGALNAITTLLDTPHSHAVLRAILPSVGNLIHDKVERVRLAAVQMLLKIKKVRGIKYYHVVPVDHLNARLAEEGTKGHKQGAVASALTGLMLNSYVPQGPKVSAVDQVNRTLSFLSSDPDAASVFYANVSEHLPVDAIAKLAAMLLRCLVSAIETEEKQSKGKKKRRSSQRLEKKRRSGERLENQDEDGDGKNEKETTLTASNTSLMASLVETICILCESIEQKLEDPENEACAQWFFDSFSGSVLLKSLTHFERKATMIESNTEEANEMRQDCYRTCTNILRCAACLPPKTVHGLVKHTSSVLSSLSDSKAKCPAENISAHITLLCVWGMTDEASSSLSRSILSNFDGGDEFVLASPLKNSKKRRSSTRKKQGETVPLMPHLIALEVLEEMLRGSDPGSVTARELIFDSATATSSIEEALQKGVEFAGRLVQTSVLPVLGFSNSDVEFVLRLCEVYGRFVLHSEAYRNPGIEFSRELEFLIQLTSEKVVPALSIPLAANVPFLDPDLSRISLSDSMEYRASMTPVPPARQRMNLSKTPEKLDGVFQSMQKKDRSDDSAYTSFARAAAVTLMQSSCVILSEWIAVGGSGATNIASAAVEWCNVLGNKNKNNRESSKTQDDLLPDIVPGEEAHVELLPAFSRLAAQLCITANIFDLLKKLLLCCDEFEAGEEKESSPMGKMLSSLLSVRGEKATNIVQGTVDAILCSAYEIIACHDKSDLSFEVPSSMDDVWSVYESKGCINSALSVVMSNRQASFELGRRLVENLGIQDKPCSNKDLFEAKCLWMLCESSSASGTKELNDIVRKLLDGRNVDEENHDIRNGLREFMSSIA